MTTSPNKMSEYPPYACKCCGATNGDMFEDYYRTTLNREPSDTEVQAYWVYKKAYTMAKDMLAKAEQLTIRLPKRQRTYRKRAAYWATKGVTNDQL